jgi:hypothetical protein
MDSIAKNVEDVIYKYAIKPLVDLNFTVKDYPKLTHGDLGSVDIDILANAIQSLNLSGAFNPTLEDEDYLTEILATHFSEEIDDIIEKEYGGAGYNIAGVDYDEGYASIRIDIEE